MAHEFFPMPSKYRIINRVCLVYIFRQKKCKKADLFKAFSSLLFYQKYSDNLVWANMFLHFLSVKIPSTKKIIFFTNDLRASMFKLAQKTYIFFMNKLMNLFLYLITTLSTPPPFPSVRI